MSSNNTWSYSEAIYESMDDILGSQSNTVLMGQGINDPIGMFGTTKDLYKKYGEDRVIETPICEDSTTGMAVGLALNGLYPIVTHIRADFLLLSLNQLINIAAKYKYSYNGRLKTPMLIRAVVGRGWGQGPQHSQSLQATLAHIPGLKVIMPSTANQLVASYKHIVNNCDCPVISFEHRLLYKNVFYKNEKIENPLDSRIIETGKDVTVLATSYMVQECQKAAKWLKKEKNISLDIIDLQDLTNMNTSLIFNSLKKTGRLIIADTGWVKYGVAAEVSRLILENCPQVLKRPMKSLGMAHTPCPTSHALEKYFYPDAATIVHDVYDLLDVQNEPSITESNFRKSGEITFRGPF
jgi:pyruvate/2-oxoglutarate/acetoin dehydrogenase E1 component